MKKLMIFTIFAELLFLLACSELDPESPAYSSYIKLGLPVVTVDNYVSGVTTTTTASLAWKITPAEPGRIKKLYLCYKDYTPDIPADTTDYIIDLLPLLRDGQDTIHITGLHASTRFHFRPYVETIDTGGYAQYEFLNHFSTKPDVCEAAWNIISPFPGGSSYSNSTFSFSFDGKGYAGVACDAEYTGKAFDPSLWAYDPQSGQWERKADFPGTPRWDYISFSIGSKGYLGLGIIKENGMFKELFKDFWEYDALADKWKQLKDFPGNYRQEALSFAVNGRGYVLKGTSWYQDVKEMWEYDPMTDTWCERSCIPGGIRAKSTVFTLKSKAYIVGGYNNAGLSLSDVWQYDPILDVWTRKTDFPGDGRSDMYVFSFDSIAVVGEGSGRKLYDHCMWQYNSSTDSWRDKRNAPAYMNGHYVNFTVSGKGYVGNSFVSVYEYNPLVDTE